MDCSVLYSVLVESIDIQEKLCRISLQDALHADGDTSFRLSGESSF